MPAYAFVLIGAAMVVAAVLTVLAGKLKGARSGDKDAESLAFVGGVFNALFIVVLAFYTVITWQEADVAEQHAATEAANLVEVYWQVATPAGDESEHLRALVREYTTRVAHDEWTALAAGGSDPKAAELLVALRQETAKLPSDSDAREQALQAVRTIADERRARVEQASGNSDLLRVLLIGTIVGAVGMIAFPLLLGLSSGLRQIACVVVLAGVLAGIVFVSLELDYPYQGLIKVGPDAFQSALAEFQRIG